MKAAVLHDFFDKRGGGERVAMELSRTFKADLYTGFVKSSKTYDMKGIKLNSLKVNPYLPVPIRNNIIAKRFCGINGYDLYIFSGTWCTSAAATLKPNILYMHTPPRFLYDLKDHFERGMNPLKRAVFRRFVAKQKAVDQRNVRHFDAIAVNSKNTLSRVAKYYGNDVRKKCTIVNPPVDTRKFRSKKSEDYYLSTSRLDPLKRIDTVIEAFAASGRRLMIASDGPERGRLMKLASNHGNITFTGKVSEEKLVDLYSRCRATIAAAKDEDFGLVAVESLASGKPCIAADEGGFLEIIKDGMSGVFFKPGAESLNDAIEKSERIKWNAAKMMKESKKYDIKVFEKKMKSLASRIV